MMSGARACHATMQIVFACWGSGSLRSCSDARGSWEVLLGFRIEFFSTWENLLFENFCDYAFSRVPPRSGIAGHAKFSDAPHPRIFSRSIDWMPWIERQAIHPHGSIIAAPLHILLPGIVAMVAQALQPPEPELIRVVVVGLDVVGTRGGGHSAFAQAHFAQRLSSELMPSQPSPAFGSVKAHGFSAIACLDSPRARGTASSTSKC